MRLRKATCFWDWIRSKLVEDNHLLAYSTDTTGFRQYTLYVKDLRTGATFPERFERVTSVAWASDNRTLFYTVEDETTKLSHRLYRHVLGSAEPDPLLYEETDERFRIEVERARSALSYFDYRQPHNQRSPVLARRSAHWRIPAHRAARRQP